MAFSLRTFALIGTAVLILCNLLTIGLITTAERSSLAGTERVHADFVDLRARVVPLGTLIKNIQIDVIQVQQFLQDLSATRGLDGLDDGMEEAEKFAKKFADDVAAARRIAVDLGRADLRDGLDAAGTAFAEFHRFGRTMTQAYVDGGPSAGNPMMPEFDRRCDALDKSLERLIEIRDGLIEQGVARIDAGLDGVSSTLTTTARATAVAAIAATLGLFLSTVAFLRFVVHPVTALSSVMEGLAAGRREGAVPFVASRTEIGRMARATGVFRDAMEQREALRAERAADEERVQADRRRERLALADAFAASVSSVVETVGGIATAIGEDARRVDAIAGTTAERAGSVVAAAEAATTNVAAVATATDALSEAIGRVGRQMHQAGAVSTEAARQAERTNGIVRNLSEATGRIGEIVDLINAIAAQTNLLALNATIEAARAGEAGRGFAVVAQEVKTLAGQTAGATEEIARQIATVQSVTGEAVAAIRDVTTTIDEISAISRSIVAAVDEQTAATRAIARSVEDAASGARDVRTNIGSVDRATRDTTEAAGTMVRASDELTSTAARLRHEVSGFVDRIRA